MLKKIAKTTLAITSILAGAALTLASPSHASSSNNTLLSYSPHEITKVGVNGSGTAYEMTGLMDIAAEVKVHIYAGIAAHVKDWKTWLRVRTENSSWVDFSNHEVSESYPVFHRPQVVDLVVPLAVPHMTLAPVMVAYCNAMADALRAQGKSNTEIFSQDRTISVAIDNELAFHTIGLNSPDLQQAGEDDFSNKPKINLACKGREPKPPIQTADHFQPPPVDFKVRDIKLFLTTFSGANTQPNPATTCKKAQVKVRLTASKAGNAKFKLWTKVGGAAMTSKVIDAWASHDGNGGFEAEHTEWVSVSSPTFVQAKAEELVSAFGKSTPWKDITLQCTNPGGGGLATNPNTSNPDNPNSDSLPQAKTLKGDFSFVDHGSPKCTRTGKALLTFQSPKADNVHYSLDCKKGSFSGVTPVAPNPAGGYSGVALVSFDVEKTIDESCTLRTVAPYGPKDHVSRNHLFQCVTPSGHTASNDLQVDSNPPSARPDVAATMVPTVPHKVIVGTGTSHNPVPPWQCIGGTVNHNGCVCPAHKKLIHVKVRDHGILRDGSKCTERDLKPDSGSQSVDGLVKTDSEALKRRLEAAKKAAEAKRKRKEAAARARKLKAAQDAAIAQRKRDARIKAAALKLRKLKAQQAAAAALAKRKAAAALAKRRAALARKRAAPSSTGNATQMRMIRRR